MTLPPGPWQATPVGVFCFFLLAACNSDPNGPGQSNAGSAASPPAPQSSPVRPPPLPVIRGEVFSFQTGMIGNAGVNIFVHSDRGGYSVGRLQSSSLGLFEAQVEGSFVSIFASKNGFVQPCGVRRSVTGDIEVRIEMLPVSAFNSFNAPRPQLSAEPSITGTIYENTPSGPAPVAGAGLWALDPMEISLATTRSDLAGRFYMCQLPPEAEIAVYKDGFTSKWVGPFDASQPTVLQIVLERVGR
jgi:hypothetical protein